MKKAKPTAPNDVPEGTTELGEQINWFRITLKISSEKLVPKTITEIFNYEPDDSQQSGRPILRDDGSIKRIPKFGAWKLVCRPKDTDEWDCCEAALELMRKLPSDKNIWKSLAEKYYVQILFGLSFESSNVEFYFSNEFHKFVGERGINTSFDIYHEVEDDNKLVLGG